MSFGSSLRANALVIISLGIGVTGLVAGGGGLYLAVQTTKELHSLEYTVRHDVGNPEDTALGRYVIVYEKDANGEVIMIPCEGSPPGELGCYKTHLVRQTGWQEMERQHERLNELERKTRYLSAYDVNMLRNYLDPEVLVAVQREWRAEHDPDSDGYWDYGVNIDACPHDPEDAYLSESPDGTVLHGCPDKDDNGVADKFESVAVEDADPVETVPEGPLDGDVNPKGPEFDRQVGEFCAKQNPVKHDDGKFYLSGCTEGGSDFAAKTIVCTVWDNVSPFIHDCDYNNPNNH